MATVSEVIGSLLSTVQGSANQMVGTVNAYTYALLGEFGESLFDDLGSAPEVGNLPANTFVAPTSLLTMLDDAKASLEEIGGEIPALADIINLSESAAVDSYIASLGQYRDQLVARAATVQVSQARLYPMASQVRLNAENVTSALSTTLGIPAFASAAFANQFNARLLEQGEYAYQAGLAAEKILNVTVQAQIDEATARRALLETQALLDFSNSAMEGAIAIIRKTIVSPEDIVKLFSQLSRSRTEVATGIAANRSAYAGTYMEYINALVGYYDLFGQLEKVRLQSESLTHEMDATDNQVMAAGLVGAASASAAAAAAGYSATRVGIQLTDKAFS